MIIKSYEIAKKSLISKFNFFLFYGENIGLKIDLKNLLKKEFAKSSENYEEFIFYEDEILENEKNFYNTILSDSLFSKSKLIIIN